MSREKKELILRIVKLTNPLFMEIPIMLAWIYYYNPIVNLPSGLDTFLINAIIFFILYYTFGRIYEAFNVYLLRISEMAYSQAIALILTEFVMYLVYSLFAGRLVNIIPFLLCLLVQFMVAVLWSLFVHRWYYRTFPPQPTTIIYDMRSGKGMEQLISDWGMGIRFNVVNTVSVNDMKPEHLDDVKVVFLCGIHSHERNMICKYCVEHEITVFTIPRIGDLLMSSAVNMHMFHLPMQRIERCIPVPEYRMIKRLFDFFVALIAFIVLIPVQLMVALAIKLEDGGPVIFSQERLTKNGKVFKLFKFRSMKVDAEADGVARLSTGSADDRVTKVGRFLRRFRLDEIPQLVNIIIGEMSIVGPRPERPEIAARYEEVLPEFRLRLQVKAGLTGYAQVYGSYKTEPYDKLQLDLMYIARPSFFEDLRIMLATIKILLRVDSTEGISEGELTALKERAHGSGNITKN